MEIRDLRALYEVIQTGSFTEAANRLGYTQSAVSQQIASMETELGRRLVTRRPVRATAAGARLAEHAAHILLRLEVAKSELAHLNRLPERVRLSVSPLADRQAVFSAIARLRAAEPTIRLTVSSFDPAAAVAALATGEIDGAFVDGLAAPNEPLHLADAGLLTASSVANRSVAVALPVLHPLARYRRLDLDTLVDAPWVTAPHLVDQSTLDRLGVPGRHHQAAVYEGRDVRTWLSMVAVGLGAALVPASPDTDQSGVVLVPVGQPDLAHRTELLCPRLRGSPIESAMRILRQVSTDQMAGDPPG
jgi:DNA-binding transcriptional LysR family regulator